MSIGRRKQEVTEGQRFRKLDSTVGSIWQVVGLRQDGMGARHAQLVRLDDPKTAKTLALVALLDPQQYERLPEE